MKLNLPSTWTSEKITSLIFLTWLSANRVDAGQAFKNCLASEDTNTTTYDLLLKYPFASNSNITSGGVLNLCCINDKCLPCDNLGNCAPCTYGGTNAGCAKINSLIFCRIISPCRGIVGNEPIIANSTFGGGCLNNVSIDSLANCLANIPMSKFIGIDKGYAYISGKYCDFAEYFEYCNWDNGGWTYNRINIDSNISRSCLIQWPAPWPGPADKNPFPLVATTSSVTSPISSTIFTSLVVSSATSLPKPNPHLAEKIAIPIATTVGIGSTGGLVYYFWRRKKRKLSKQTSERQTNQEVVKLETFEAEQSAHEVYLTHNWGQSQNQQQSQQAQIEVNPYLAFKD